MLNTATKVCRICNKELGAEYFYKDKSSKDGLRTECKPCHNATSKRNYDSNKEEIILKRKLYRYANPDKIRNVNRNWSKSNPTKVALQRKRYSEKYPEKSAVKRAKYRAKKLQATPSWLTQEHLDEIKDLYTACRAFQLFTGLTYHVDHIIPLQGKTVCGLHVPWNLQILEASENIKKSNKLEEE